jgi:NAD(P)-dependent dehydrogenase (short-subunit alcohol dehydrogenase family)
MTARERAAVDGKSAIVTGGASGIGKALGARLLGLGAHVVLADIDGDRAAEAASELTVTVQDRPGSIVGTQLDVRDRDAVHALVEDVTAKRGTLDLLFNNAGLAMGGPTQDMPGAYWDRMIDVNITGVVNGVLAAYPVMLDQGSGHIINTASGAGLLAAPFVAAYAMTKHAVVGLSLALRPEGAAHGVRVSVLCPGMVETPILDKGPPADLPERHSSALTGRAYLETAGMSPMPADRLARIALRGVARNRAIIVAPRTVRAGWYLGRLSPNLIDAAGRLTARRVRTQMAKLPAAKSRL